MSPEHSVSQDSVMNAISTPSRASITLSVLLHIERTFHSRQEIEFSIVRGYVHFLLPDSMACCPLTFFGLSCRLGICEMLHYVLYLADLPSCSLYSGGVKCHFCASNFRIHGSLHYIFHRKVILHHICPCNVQIYCICYIF